MMNSQPSSGIQLFAGVRQNMVKLRPNCNNDYTTDLTMPALVFFGLLTIKDFEFNINSTCQMFKKVSSKKVSYFIKASLNQKPSQIQELLNKHNLKIDEDNEIQLQRCKDNEQPQLYSYISCQKHYTLADIADKFLKSGIEFIYVSHKFVLLQKEQSVVQLLQQQLKMYRFLDQIKKWPSLRGKKITFYQIILYSVNIALDEPIKYGTKAESQKYRLLREAIQKRQYPEKQNYSEKIQNFIEKIKNADFSNITLFFSTKEGEFTEFQKDLLFICDNWNIYGPKLQEKISIFQDIMDFKVNAMSQFSLIFPNIPKIIKQIQLKNQYVGARKFVQENLSDDITDTLYIHFIQQLQAKTLKHSPFYIKEQKSNNKQLVGDVMASKTQYDAQIFQNAFWQDIFGKARVNVRRIAAQESLGDDKLNSDQKALEAFISDIGKERLIDLRCISCCPIFYTDTNIFDPIVNRTPMELVDKITKLPDLLNDLKLKICYLLNNEGGVILFDVVRKYREFIPMGEFFTKKDQQIYVQKLEAIIQTISPKPQIGQNIEITFVPIVKNPMTNILSTKKQVRKPDKVFDNIYYQRAYVDGMFVARIKVKPTTPWKTYYWTNGDKIVVPEKENSLVFKPMNPKKVFSFMQQKFMEHYIPQDLSEQERQERIFFAPKSTCFHPGKCAPPDGGNPLYDNKTQKQIQENPQKKYSQMNLLIARKSDHQTIKERLRRRGIECEIVNLYKQHSFKAANNSAAIYHNVRFDQLLTEISYNRDFQFAGRYAMVIFIAEFLKLPDYNNKNYMTLDGFNNLQSWIKRLHSGQQLKLWRYDSGNEQQFYLQTQSKKSTVLMYYIMTQYGEKCIFKNPKNYDRLTPEQKQSKIKVFYPISAPRNHNESEPVVNNQTFQYLQNFGQIDSNYFYQQTEESQDSSQDLMGQSRNQKLI